MGESNYLTESENNLLTEARALVNNNFTAFADRTNLLTNNLKEINISCKTPDCGPTSSAYLKGSNIKSASSSIKDARKKIKQDWDNLKNRSITSSENAIINHSPSFDRILHGVVAYVEMRSSRKNAINIILKSMGATVYNNFTKEVTHVIYKNGTLETYKRAKLLNVHLVSVLWVESCHNSKRKICEKLFPVDCKNDYTNSPRVFRKFLQNQSKNFEYDPQKCTLIRKVLSNPAININKPFVNPVSRKKSISADSSPISTTNEKSRESISESSSKESFKLRISTDSDGTSSNEADISNQDDNPLKNNPGNSKSVSTTKRRLFANQPRKASFLNLTPEEYKSSQLHIPELPKPYEDKSANTTNKKNNIKNKHQVLDKNLDDEIGLPLPSTIYAIDTMKLFPVTQTTFKKSPEKKSKKYTLVSTFLHSDEIKYLNEVISRLGRFILKPKVNSQTTHVVAGEPFRTINLLKGIARGCWILNKKWFIESDNAGYWLAEEQYEMIEFSQMVHKCRIQRQAFGRDFALEIFDECGTIFVTDNCEPPSKDISHLIKLCGGTLAISDDSADIVVGKYVDGKTCVSEKWILDSITWGRCKSKLIYSIKN